MSKGFGFQPEVWDYGGFLGTIYRTLQGHSTAMYGNVWVVYGLYILIPILVGHSGFYV